MDSTVKLCADKGKELADSTMYRKIVGSLIYLTLTRPDLAFEVGVLSRYMQTPRKRHLDVIRHVLRYVKHTFNMGVRFNQSEKLELSGFCEADYAGDLDTRRSTTGFVFKLGRGAVTWCSKRQPTVSLSTTEAEYRAATMAAQEVTWLWLVLEELKHDVKGSVVIHCDNMSSIQLAENLIFHTRSKHVEVHYHFIREKVLEVEINLKYVSTLRQEADMFTKSLLKEKLKMFQTQISMEEVNIEREY
ncbi:secreted RxLR effector protein 161-like [Helianthus annuus]|uniref:secreted RxLR effector protein 161-like n=1 Tax=Helianthus annuus TaxID=4232 RepID=UPI001652E6D3|nr:secreted RxLR effector protein 161-like [Helianthus annuus]